MRGVHSGTSPSRATVYGAHMKSHNLKVAAAAWTCAVGVGGVLAGVASVPIWIALVGCALAPPLLLTMYSVSQPDATLSESIQQVLR